MAGLKLSESIGCWVDLFDSGLFQGRRIRLWGPAEFMGMRIAADGWSDRVESVIVGPGAYVTCFYAGRFEETVGWLLPGQKVEAMKEVGIHELDSLRIFDRPPFTHEPGFSAYVLWAAGHIAKLRSAQTGLNH